MNKESKGAQRRQTDRPCRVRMWMGVLRCRIHAMSYYVMMIGKNNTAHEGIFRRLSKRTRQRQSPPEKKKNVQKKVFIIDSTTFSKGSDGAPLRSVVLLLLKKGPKYGQGAGR